MAQQLSTTRSKNELLLLVAEVCLVRVNNKWLYRLLPSGTLPRKLVPLIRRLNHSLIVVWCQLSLSAGSLANGPAPMSCFCGLCRSCAWPSAFFFDHQYPALCRLFQDMSLITRVLVRLLSADPIIDSLCCRGR